MEEDVAKQVHEMEGRVPVSLVDFNRAGQSKAMGFLIGQVMQVSGGKANPKIIHELLA
jgi:aspartyl-tRNA(Asn)/glutamyl-tRNA(Gln) amidotransferase subunit B